MHRAALLALTFFSLLTSSVAACDLAGPAPGPGHFYLFDATAGAETRIDVTGRWLGAGCELSNPFAYDGKRFAWSEGPERSDASQAFYLREEDGAHSSLPIPAKQVRGLGLTSSHVYYLEQTTSSAVLGRIRISDQESEVLSVQPPFHAILSGAHLGWFSSDGKRISVYDGARQEWILRDDSLAGLRVPTHDQGELHVLNERFAMFSTYLSTQAPTTTYRYWTYEFATATLHEIKGLHEPRSAWIDGSVVYAVYFADDGLRLESMPAIGGAPRHLGPLPHGVGQRLVVVGSTVVLASYTQAAVHTHAADPSASGWHTSPGPDEDPWSVASIPISFFLLAVVVAFFWRRHL